VCVSTAYSSRSAETNDKTRLNLRNRSVLEKTTDPHGNLPNGARGSHESYLSVVKCIE
jgi:hypothetical protein